MLSVHATQEKLKNATINRSFLELCLKTQAHFQRAPFSIFCPHGNERRTSVFQLPPLWRAISKSSVFVTDYGVDGRPYHRVNCCVFKFPRRIVAPKSGWFGRYNFMPEAYGKSTIRVILYNSNLQFQKKVVELIYTKQSWWSVYYLLSFMQQLAIMVWEKAGVNE